jgi:hypothetical protein
MPTTSFPASRLKIKRAKAHVQELNETMQAYWERDAVMVAIEEDTDRAHLRLVLQVREDPPCELPAIIGDAIHNLRAALDLLAVRLVELNGGNTEAVYFPFADKFEYFEARIKKTRIDRAAPDVVDMIRRLRPYPGGDDTLRALHDFDITDKHKTIVPTITGGAPPDYQILDASGAVLSSFRDNFFSLIDGTFIARIPISGNAHAGQQFRARLFVSLRGVPFSGQPIKNALGRLVGLVESIVASFEARYPVTR